MFKIDKTDQNVDLIKELKKKLTVSPQINSGLPFVKPVYIKMFSENDSELHIPFAFAHKYNYVTKEDVLKRNQTIEQNATKVDFQWNGEIKLRDYQVACVDKTIHSLKNTCGGLMNMSVGSGKTICGVNLISKMKKKALVVVHKQFLSEEFKKSIDLCMPGTPVSYIQGPRVDFSGDIVIAMMQTLVSKHWDKEVFNQFGVVCFDETHRVCAHTWIRSVLNLDSVMIIGLSATVQRKDGLKPQWLVGEIAFKYDNTSKNSPQVYVIDYKDEKPIDFVFNRAGTPNLPLFINNLTKDPDRNSLIIETLEKLYIKNEEDISDYSETPQRYTLVCSDRRNHLEQLYDMIQENNTLNKYKVGFVVGGMKKDAFEESSKNSDILLGSYQMISEGFNVPRLNSIILTTPKGDVVQTTGRILRKNHVGITPIIIDIVDSEIYPFKGSMFKRLRFYKSKDFPITHCNSLEIEDSGVYSGEDEINEVDGVPGEMSGDFGECLL
tara:strand:+ start:7873 stop:9354 length:1482 start_codon:yes stop_codon:yes gene_type:complete